MVTSAAVIQTFRTLARVPSPCSVVVTKTQLPNGPSSFAVETVWSQRDLEKAESTKYVNNWNVLLPANVGDEPRLIPSGRPLDVTSEVWRAPSPSGEKVAVVRKVGVKSEEKHFVEVWSRKNKLLTVDLEKQEKHGKVYADDAVFGCFEWSHDEKFLVYMAEKKRPKTESFFTPFGKTKKIEDGADKKKALPGEKHTFVEEWGEQLVGKSQPVICVLDTATGQTTALDAILPEGISPGECVWMPPSAAIDPLTVVFVGFSHADERLGLVYCPIRPAALYMVELSGILSKEENAETEEGAKKMASAFGPSDKAVRSPRFSPEGLLAFLENPVGGPHWQCSKLQLTRLDPSSGWRAPETLVDVVTNWSRADAFAGVYADASTLPHRCWTSDGKIYFNTFADCKSKVFLVDAEKKSTVVDPQLSAGSHALLGVFDDVLVFSTSGIDSKPALHLASVQRDTPTTTPLHLTLPTTPHPLGVDPRFRFESHYLTLDPTCGPSLQYSAMLHLPPRDSQGATPLIVFPHGGPHSAFTNAFSLYVAGFLHLGFAVLAVNYRGSIGQGQASIDSLPGHVGDYDVADVHGAALHVLEKDQSSGGSLYRLDASQVVAFGGSHGGFLTAHLIGQYPDFYKAAVCRNPVINLTNMFGVTDIPDWTFVEGMTHGAAAYRAGGAPSPAQVQELISRSPIFHVQKVKCPVLILIGMKDLRVPPSQGIQFFKALKAKGNKVDMKTFPDDCHPLSKIETESESFVLIMNWFLTHLGLLEEGSGVICD